MSLDAVQEYFYDRPWLKITCAILIPVLALKFGGVIWLLGSFVLLFVAAVWLEFPSQRRQAVTRQVNLNGLNQEKKRGEVNYQENFKQNSKQVPDEKNDTSKPSRNAKPDKEFAIGMVDVKPSALIVRDTNGNFLDQISSGVPMSLVGYTQNTVTVERGGFKRMYQLKKNGKLQFVKEYR